MDAVLVFPERVRGEIETRVAAAYPEEACGLLLGHAAGATTRVTRQWPARNVEPVRARDRFQLDPLDYLAAEAAASAAGEALVGVWHSHPDHPARPSETDRALAWPGWSYLIVEVGAQGAADWRSWRLDGDDFAEEEVRHD